MTCWHDCYEEPPVTWKDALLIGLVGGSMMAGLIYLGLFVLV